MISVGNYPDLPQSIRVLSGAWPFSSVESEKREVDAQEPGSPNGRLLQIVTTDSG